MQPASRPTLDLNHPLLCKRVIPQALKDGSHCNIALPISMVGSRSVLVLTVRSQPPSAYASLIRHGLHDGVWSCDARRHPQLWRCPVSGPAQQGGHESNFCGGLACDRSTRKGSFSALISPAVLQGNDILGALTGILHPTPPPPPGPPPAPARDVVSTQLLSGTCCGTNVRTWQA